MATLQVHRCRFVEYMPSTIHALAFSPETHKSCRLACARANGDIELWNFRGAVGWHQEIIIPGNPSSNIESITWTHQTTPVPTDTDHDEEEDEKSTDPAFIARETARLKAESPRLFSAGLNGLIIEWDLLNLKPKLTVESNGGAVWCIAGNPAGTVLAVGCEDGCVRLFDVADGGLEYIRSLDRQEGRILSVCFDLSRSYLYTGSSDSCLRKYSYSATSAQCIQRLTVDTLKGDDTFIWAIAALKDGILVAGDSLGNVSFWDQTGTLIKGIKAHQADVLCLAASKVVGGSVFSAGVDGKIVQFRRVDARNDDERKKKRGKGKGKGHGHDGYMWSWVVSGEKRYHTHDIRALTLFEKRPVDALVSGGVDTILTISSPVSTFPAVKQYRMPAFPHRPLISVARSARLVMCRFADHVKVWRLGSPLPTERPIPFLPDRERLELKEKEKLLIEIKVKGTSNLTASAISDDGAWIAISDIDSIRLFRIIKDHVKGGLKVRKIRAFPSPSYLPGAHALIFTPTAHHLIAACTDSTVAVVDISRVDSTREIEIVRRFTHHRGGEIEDHELGGADGDVDMNMEITATSNQKRKGEGRRELVCSLAVSDDGMWLATGDMANRIYIFNLDNFKHHATLPRFFALHTSISFSPKSATLVVTCASNEFYLYNTEERRLSDWSRECSHRLPMRWLGRKELIVGVAYDPAQQNTLTIWGNDYMCFVDLSKPVGPRDAIISFTKRKKIEESGRSERRRHEKTSHTRGALGAEHDEKREVEDGQSEPENNRDEAEGKDEETEHDSEEENVKSSTKKIDTDIGVPREEYSIRIPNGVHPLNEIRHTKDTSRNHQEDDGDVNIDESSEGKRLRGDTEVISNSFRMVHRFKPHMIVDFVGDNEMVVVERPTLKILESVGESFYRHRYGT